MGVARLKTLNPKDAKAMRKTTTAKAVKQIKDDELKRNRFLSTLEKIDKDTDALYEIEDKIEELREAILKKHMTKELTDLEKEAKKLDRRVNKNTQSISNQIMTIARDLSEGAKSLFFSLEKTTGNRSTKYKQVCEDLVEDKKVSQRIMDKYLEQNTSRKQKINLKLENKEINTAMFGINLNEDLED